MDISFTIPLSVKYKGEAAEEAYIAGYLDALEQYGYRPRAKNGKIEQGYSADRNRNAKILEKARP